MGYKIRNILCMPVISSKNQTVAVVQLANKTGNVPFNHDDEERFRDFAASIGIILESCQSFYNVLLEKQYQKDILQSLSDAVISTDMAGQIVTINDAALELLGCPIGDANSKNNKLLWEQNLIGRLVWEVVSIENLQMQLEDSLKTGAKHYVPEQSLMLGLYQVLSEELEVKSETQYSGARTQHSILAVRDRTNPDIFIPWNQPLTPQSEFLTSNEVQTLERNINLTVNPLINPEGCVRGGLVVLEDITLLRKNG